MDLLNKALHKRAAKKALKDIEAFNDTGRPGEMLTFETGKPIDPLSGMDAVMGAPFRTLVKNLQDGEYRDAFPRAVEQFGSDPENSPTWDEILTTAGVPEELELNPGGELPYKGQMYPGGSSKVNPRAVGGFLASMVEPDVPGMGMAGMAKKIPGTKVWDATEDFMEKSGKDISKAAQRMYPEAKPDEAQDLMRQALERREITDVDLADPLDKLHGRTNQPVTPLGENKVASFQDEGLSLAPLTAEILDENPEISEEGLKGINRLALRFNDSPRMMDRIKGAQRPSNMPYEVVDGGPLPTLPNFRAQPSKTGVIGFEGIQEPFHSKGAESFPWMDSKYGASKELMAKAKRPLQINTSSDLIARRDYVDAIPKGSTVNMFMLTPNDMFNRRIFPGNPSQKRLEKAAAQLEGAGVKVNRVYPTIDEVEAAITRKDTDGSRLNFGDAIDWPGMKKVLIETHGVPEKRLWPVSGPLQKKHLKAMDERIDQINQLLEAPDLGDYEAESLSLELDALIKRIDDSMKIFE